MVVGFLSIIVVSFVDPYKKTTFKYKIEKLIQIIVYNSDSNLTVFVVELKSIAVSS